jgi:rhamnosyl/mannosyltransferase
MFGMVQLEAMSFGKPVISTKIPNSGVHEVSLDGVTGFSVPIMNSNALADAILRLKGDSTLRRSMGQAGQKRVREVFDRSVVIPQFVRMFRSCLGYSGSSTGKPQEDRPLSVGDRG